MFPSNRKGVLESRAPILITTNTSISIPSDAVFMNVFLIGGGGSGGLAANAGAAAYASGAGSGGALYFRINLKLYRGNLPRPTSRPTSASFTIGSGANGNSFVGFNQATGNAGGSSTFTIEGGFTVTVSGGGAGVGDFTVPVTTGGAAGGSTTSFVSSRISAIDAVIARPLWGAPSAAADAYTGDGGFAGGSAPSGSGQAGGSVSSSFLTPWWLQAVGLSPGTGGAGATVASNRNAGGGGGGWGGNGGAAKADNTGGSVTGNAGTGYGSGGGGVMASSSAGSTITSGAGAPGAAVVMFEVEV